LNGGEFRVAEFEQYPVFLFIYESKDMRAVFTEPMMAHAVVASPGILVGLKPEKLSAAEPMKSSRTRWVGTFWMELLIERHSRPHFAAG